MNESCATSGQPHRALHLLLLALLCLAALWLKTEGIAWPKFHPDEYPIGEWIDQTADHWYFTDKVYAGGFFTLARPVQRIARAVSRRAHACAFHQGKTDLPENAPFDAILFARWFNVWLAVLTCLVLYGLARRVTGSGGAGLLAAALFAFAQHPMEHGHYGETDLALVFMLSLACWLWAVAIGNRGAVAFAAAAAVSGFAAGIKFPMALLILLVPTIGLLRIAPPRTGRRWMAGWGGILLGLGWFVLGFLLANPRIVMDWSGFQAGLAWESRRIYGETALNMGPLWDRPSMRYYQHLLAWGEYCRTLGWAWIALIPAGVCCAFLKPHRRFWPLLFLLPALNLIYWIFAAPWVRSQEFMTFLPVLAVLAALPPALLWRAGRPALRAAAILAAGLAVAFNAENGLRAAALFGWTDTRLLAQQWMEQRLPDTIRLAAEPYTEQACPRFQNPPQPTGGKIERRGLAPLREEGVDFILRADSNTGRGLRHPLTGRRYPDTQRLFDEFCDHSERLATWGPLTDRPLATFISPTVELWGLNKFAPRHTLDLELAQPLSIADAYQLGKLRPASFPVGRKLGGAAGLIIDKRPRVLALGGPKGVSDAAYLVLNTEERGAVVRIRGCGRRQSAELAPYSIAIVPLRRRFWPGRGMPFERIVLSAEPRENITYIPCYARIAYGAEEAGRICADLGRPDAAWRAFSEQQLDGMRDPILRYRLAVSAQRWEQADRWEAEAIRAGATLAAALASDPDDIEINGNSGHYYDALATARLQDHGLVLDNPPAGKLVEKTTPLSVRLAHGVYELSGELVVKPDPGQELPAEIELAFNGRRPWLKLNPGDAPAGPTPFSVRFTTDAEIQATITARSKLPVTLIFQNLAIRWSLTPVLNAVYRSLMTARAAHALRRNRCAAALDLLDKLDAAADLPDALELRQLKFRALRGRPDSDPARLAGAARDVLALAPATYDCLRALADTDPAARAEEERLRGSLKQPVACGPFLTLVGVSFDPARKELACVVEALRNETPPLAVAIHLRRHDWRKRQSEPLSDRPRLHRGERAALRIALNESGAAPAAEDIALGIESAAQWHPGALPIAGRRSNVIPLAEIGP